MRRSVPRLAGGPVAGFAGGSVTQPLRRSFGASVAAPLGESFRSFSNSFHARSQFDGKANVKNDQQMFPGDPDGERKEQLVNAVAERLRIQPNGRTIPYIVPGVAVGAISSDIDALADGILRWEDETLTSMDKYELFWELRPKIWKLQDLMSGLEIIFAEDFKNEGGILVKIRDSIANFEERVKKVSSIEGELFPYELRCNFEWALYRWYGFDLQAKYCPRIFWPQEFV